VEELEQMNLALLESFPFVSFSLNGVSTSSGLYGKRPDCLYADLIFDSFNASGRILQYTSKNINLLIEYEALGRDRCAISALYSCDSGPKRPTLHG
jgi:hypothetical protein